MSALPLPPPPSRPPLPVIPIAAALAGGSPVGAIRRFDRLAALFHDVIQREPPVDDPARWHEHAIGGRAWRFARPLTFTPYAASAPCSARCGFCSENLREDDAAGPPASTLRPGPGYFDALRGALAALDGVPLAYSLSGLESTDDPDWLLALLDTLSHARPGPRREGAVLYTNGAGLAAHGDRLLPALRDFGLDWIEWSRHHDDGAANQALMRFRPGLAIASQDVFERTLRDAAARLPVKLVCLVQRGGIETPADVTRYADRAAALGASAVIFREFSALPPHYRDNATRRHVEAARLPVDALLDACVADGRALRDARPVALTGGYYFWNARWRRADGLELVFEKSDYGTMREREASGRVYKLVFHADGQLCAGWQPGRDVLWRAGDAR